jgi:hypothetical protein
MLAVQAQSLTKNESSGRRLSPFSRILRRHLLRPLSLQRTLIEEYSIKRLIYFQRREWRARMTKDFRGEMRDAFNEMTIAKGVAHALNRSLYGRVALNDEGKLRKAEKTLLAIDQLEIHRREVKKTLFKEKTENFR